MGSSCAISTASGSKPLPSVQTGLHMTVTAREWVVTAYTLALAGLLLLGGRLADRIGARRTLLVGAGFARPSAVRQPTGP